MNDIIIKQISTDSIEYEALLDLRDLILRRPLGLNLRDEDLSDDANDIILIAISGDKMIGCVMLHPSGDGVIRLRQMAVLEEWQGKGVGTYLVREAEKAASQHRYRKMILHARMGAKEFYEKLGYRQTGEVFTEVNIPHIIMEKSLV